MLCLWRDISTGYLDKTAVGDALRELAGRVDDVVPFAVEVQRWSQRVQAAA